ncbi:hypothetical protein Taro_044684 [Colocasia esculenta]|uniref:Uncharacterized protein n=1 Tax=Colocasia esculenta TaxID=4460 RepID=A0A843X3N4_COLES|nr:hypothetical protein [Colocasia esculenta]
MENGGGRGEPLLAPAIDADCEKGGGRGRSVVSVDDADADYRSMLQARDDFFLRFDGGAWKRRNYDLDASNAPPSNGSSVNEGRRSRATRNDDPRARTSSLCHFVIPVTSCSSLRAFLCSMTRNVDLLFDLEGGDALRGRSLVMGTVADLSYSQIRHWMGNVICFGYGIKSYQGPVIS